ncbi:MAG: hypothetical protein WAM30_09900 [Candidatus Dormiibacterota bacterium]
MSGERTSVRDHQPPEPGARPPGRDVVLRRLAIASGVLTVLAAADALYMQLSGYHAADVNNFHLSDAGTVFVAAGLLLGVTVALLLLAARAARSGTPDSTPRRDA